MTEWNEVERGKITRNVFAYVSVFQSSLLHAKGSDTIENIRVFASANIICIENEQSVDDANMYAHIHTVLNML